MNKHQIKGVLISLLFVVAIVGLGIDLGRFFWILLVLLLFAAAIYFTVGVATRSVQGKRGTK